MIIVLQLALFFAMCAIGIVVGFIALYFLLRYVFVILGLMIVYTIVMIPFTVNSDVVTSTVISQLSYSYSNNGINIHGNYTTNSKYKITGARIKCRVQSNPIGESEEYSEYFRIKDSSSFSVRISNVKIRLDSYYPSPNVFCKVSHFHGK